VLLPTSAGKEDSPADRNLSDKEQCVAGGLTANISRGLFKSRPSGVHVAVMSPSQNAISSKVTHRNESLNVHLRRSELSNPMIPTISFNTQRLLKWDIQRK
jgi:hypothetical protein